MEVNTNFSSRLDIKCKRGDTFSLQLKFWSDPAKTVPIDITTMTFLMVAKEIGSTLSFEMEAEITIASPNILTITKPASEMNRSFKGYYDLQKQLSDGTVSTLLNGIFHIIENVAA